MVYLLDVSTIIALIARTHVGHATSNQWFASNAGGGWATCPIVENGVIRIMSQPAYPNAQASPTIVTAALRQLCRLPGHEFWPDSLSLLDSAFVDVNLLPSARHITDAYLLALAASHSGKLATIDRKLSTMAVRNGAQHLELIS
jgi:toxin-antitoxin system PIN domain toxin